MGIRGSLTPVIKWALTVQDGKRSAAAVREKKGNGDTAPGEKDLSESEKYVIFICLVCLN